MLLPHRDSDSGPISRPLSRPPGAHRAQGPPWAPLGQGKVWGWILDIFGKTRFLTFFRPEASGPPRTPPEASGGVRRPARGRPEAYGGVWRVYGGVPAGSELVFFKFRSGFWSGTDEKVTFWIILGSFLASFSWVFELRPQCRPELVRVCGAQVRVRAARGKV